MAVNVNDAVANFHRFSRKADDAFDKRLGAIEGIPEDDDVAAVDGLKAVDELIDEDALLIGKKRGHAGSFDLYGLIEENDDHQGEADGDEEVASPHTNFVTEQLVRGSGRNRGFGGQKRIRGGRGVALWREVVLVVFAHLGLPFLYNMASAD